MPRVETTEQEFKFYDSQYDFVVDESKWQAFIAGRGAGKSFAGCVKDIVHAEEFPGSEGAVCAPSYPMLRDTTRKTVLSMLRRDQVKRYSRVENVLELKNGSIIYFRSLDNPDSVRGLNLSFVHIDEAGYVTKEAWDILKACLRQPGFPHRAWITSTPKGKNWIYDEWVANPTPQHSIHRARSSDNLHLPDGFEDSLGYSGVFFLQEILGSFESFEGLVYPTYRRDLVQPLPSEPKFKKVIAGVDWGYRDPAVIIVVGQTWDKSLVVLDEFYKRGITIDEHLSVAKEFRDKWRIRRFHADPSRPDAIDLFTKGGLRVAKAQNDILAGVAKVASYLPKGREDAGRLLIAPSCIETINEFEEYSYPQAPEGTRQTKNYGEKPIDIKNHTMDALRYAVMAFAGGAERHIYY